MKLKLISAALAAAGIGVSIWASAVTAEDAKTATTPTVLMKLLNRLTPLRLKTHQWWS